MVNPYLSECSRSERIRAVKRVALYAFAICAVTLFTGHWVLELFGLSVPIIRLGGGIMICKVGWEFLSSDKPNDSVQNSNQPVGLNETEKLDEKLFFPITFPLTTGAGTIAVLFTLSAHADTKDLTRYFINSSAILAAILGMCILVFFFYINARRLVIFLGTRNEKIVNRLMAFLIFCVGLQIAMAGIVQLVKADFKF